MGGKKGSVSEGEGNLREREGWRERKRGSFRDVGRGIRSDR